MSNPTNKGGEGPQRRCVVCRNSDRKRALLRFVVAPDGEILFDVRQRAPGRGILVCPSPKCLERAASGGFRRGAKSSDVRLPGGADWVDTHVIAPLWKVYRETLSLGRQSGGLVVGSETVERAARAEELASYVLATDASEGTRKKFSTNAQRKEMPVFGLLSRDALAELIGKENPVVLGWKIGTLGARFGDIETQLVGLGVVTVREKNTTQAGSSEEEGGGEEQLSS